MRQVTVGAGLWAIRHDVTTFLYTLAIYAPQTVYTMLSTIYYYIYTLYDKVVTAYKETSKDAALRRHELLSVRDGFRMLICEPLCLAALRRHELLSIDLATNCVHDLTQKLSENLSYDQSRQDR